MLACDWSDRGRGECHPEKPAHGVLKTRTPHWVSVPAVPSWRVTTTRAACRTTSKYWPSLAMASAL